jgi:hypothetical protein
MTNPRKYLCRFNHFSLQLGSKKPLHQHLQAIVWYAESRFRQALIKISHADRQRQTWMQSCLADELVRLQ